MDNQIEKYSGFKAELAIVETFAEIKILESKASAIAEFVKKNKIGLEEQNQWGIFRVEIETKKGKWLDEKFPHGAKKGINNREIVSCNVSSLQNEGINYHESSNARLVANEPEFKKKAINDIIGKGGVVTPTAVSTAIRKEINKEKTQKLKPQELPKGEFDIIYADPPWEYDFFLAGSRSIQSHYPVMTDEEIKNLKIPFAENCVLFLWATAPKLENALSIMRYWGFEYKSCGVWDKQIIGMGYWFRGQHEILLVGVKGKYSPPIASLRESSIHSEKRTQHSKKPNYYYELIEKYFPNGKYLELFARTKYNDKWTTWGNQEL